MRARAHVSVLIVVALAAVLGAFLFTPTAAASVSMQSITSRFGLNVRHDTNTDRYYLTGEGMEVVLCPGMRTVLINGKASILAQPVSAGADGPLVPPELMSLIDKARVRPKPGVEEQRPEPERPNAPPFKIVIDPGHGGKHTGGKAASGLMEKDVVLDVSLMMEAMLKQEGVEVSMTRRTDKHFADNVTDDLDKRVDLSNEEMPDLFVSVHSNYHPTPDPRGFEVFVSRPESHELRNRKVSEMMRLQHPAAELYKLNTRAKKKTWYTNYLRNAEKESRTVAKDVVASFDKHLTSNNRGCKEAGFRVIKYTHAPSILIELEFISNPIGEKELRSRAHREKLATLITEVLLDWRDDPNRVRVRK
jgi:N-acetylmuramoyl-L-alanine amidase